MVTETAVATVDTTPEDAERKRKLALLRAVGLDRVAPEQRELALAIAKRYDLDLLLKHLVLIEGRPYITRDALLHIAHRSGQFDGIEVTEPVVRNTEGVGDFWYVEASVYRKDMSHPFKYGGRYPTKGGNQKFAPEMATKVAECMALRRAFDVSAPTAEERWDTEVPVVEPEPAKTFAQKAAERAESVRYAPAVEAGVQYAEPEQTVDQETGEITEPAPKADPPTKATGTTPDTEQCESVSKLSDERCRREKGHGNLHRTENEAWTEADSK